jgi:ADP-ribosylglycohydrolase
MGYPSIPEYSTLISQLIEYSRLKCEYGATDVDDLLMEAEQTLRSAVSRVKDLPIDKGLETQEPDQLSEIRKLRPDGPRRIWRSLGDRYPEKLEGALLGRLAGCTLGAMVEFWSVKEMEDWAGHIGDEFPPVDYWSHAKDPPALRYNRSAFHEYSRQGMNGVPVDDDIMYTLLGLLIAEDFGVSFTTEDVGKAWLKYLPYACTAEDVALKNLKAGIPALEAGAKDNPYCQWIGADIRSDPWAYMAPGFPEKAAEMAYNDAYISHRRNGIYGAMFFSAAESAAFTVDNPEDAIRIGLTEIPKACKLADAVEWALQVGKTFRNYRDARQAVDDRFNGMSGVHTINNACLTVFGLMIGGTDFTRVISETVAMGMDNDCNAATAGSIVGAIAGKQGIPPHWYKRFNNTVHSYLNGFDEFKIDDLVRRFRRQAEAVFALQS